MDRWYWCWWDWNLGNTLLVTQEESDAFALAFELTGKPVLRRNEVEGLVRNLEQWLSNAYANKEEPTTK